MKAKTSLTKGAWFILTKDAPRMIFVFSTDRGPLAHMLSPPHASLKEVMANARAMAAANVMLDTLEMVGAACEKQRIRAGAGEVGTAMAEIVTKIQSAVRLAKTGGDKDRQEDVEILAECMEEIRDGRVDGMPASILGAIAEGLKSK